MDNGSKVLRWMAPGLVGQQAAANAMNAERQAAMRDAAAVAREAHGNQALQAEDTSVPRQAQGDLARQMKAAVANQKQGQNLDLSHLEAARGKGPAALALEQHMRGETVNPDVLKKLGIDQGVDKGLQKNGPEHEL